jgi:hypothetical protein
MMLNRLMNMLGMGGSRRNYSTRNRYASRRGGGFLSPRGALLPLAAMWGWRNRERIQGWFKSRRAGQQNVTTGSNLGSSFDQSQSLSSDVGRRDRDLNTPI